MKLFKIQKKNGPAPYEAKGFRSGFVILFAVTLSGILLAIALGVANIALKEINFTTSARDSNDAFFAADTGYECALDNDKFSSNTFVVSGGTGTVSCLNTTFPLTYTAGSVPSWGFTITNLGSANPPVACTKVTVAKDSTTDAPFVATTIVSKGYNIGDSSCNSTNPARIERQEQVIYSTNPQTTFAIPTPTAFWKLNGDTLDSVGTNHLVNTGGVTFTAGKLGLAGQFNGSTQSLDIGDNPVLSTGDIDFTIGAWVNLANLNTATIAAKRGDATHKEWSLLYVAPYFRFTTFDASANSVGLAQATSAPAVVPNTWYYVLAWRDKTAHTVNIQINNGPVDTVAETGAPTDTTAGFHIGAFTEDAPASNFLAGIIDEVGFWKQVLQPAQRTALYDNGNGWTYVNPGSSSTSSPSVSLSASPTSISNGNSSVLGWSSTNSTSCVGTNFSTGNNTSGNVTVSPTSNTTYSINCTGTNGSANASATVTVTAAAAPTVSYGCGSVSPGSSSCSTTSGGSVLLFWNAVNATSCILDGNPQPLTNPSGANSGPLSNTITSNLVCNGAGGQTTKTITITVAANAPPAPVSISPSSGTFAAGTSQTFTTVYSDPNGASDLKYGLFLINSAVDGNHTAFYGLAYPDGSCYLFNSWDDAGNTVGTWASQSWGIAPETLPWATLNSCSASMSGNNLTVLWNMTFGNWNEAGMTAWIYEIDNENTHPSPDVFWNMSGTSGAITATPASSPTVTLSANPTSVAYNGTTTLTWSSTNLDYCIGGNTGDGPYFYGGQGTNGSFTTNALTSPASFTLNCYKNSDPNTIVATASVSITVGSAPPPTDVQFSNNDFETPSLGSGYQYAPSSAGWSFDSAGVQGNGSAWGGANAPSGTQTAFIQTTGSISQSANMNAGSYTLSFYVARRPCCSGSNLQPIRASIDGTQVGDLVSPSGYSFQQVSIPVTISSSGSHTLTLAGTDSSADMSTFIDLVTMTAN